jgi:hypothetical protein
MQKQYNPSWRALWLCLALALLLILPWQGILAQEELTETFEGDQLSASTANGLTMLDKGVQVGVVDDREFAATVLTDDENEQVIACIASAAEEGISCAFGYTVSGNGRDILPTVAAIMISIEER